MIVCGVVAEYNPFHNGHALHLAELRRRLGVETAVVCALSGDFVQRGEPALLGKFARAEAAAGCGADLVLELPLPWAMATAQRFAMGAVSLLAATGVVTHLGFGSECGEVDRVLETAETLLRPEMDEGIRAGLAEGLPYATARQRSAESLAGKALPALQSPNDILAVEYCMGIRTLGLPLTPLCVPRQGAGHDAPAGNESLPSASALRRRLAAGEDIGRGMPPFSQSVLEREQTAGRGPVFPGSLETALLSRLRMLSLADYAALPDVSEGLENRLYRVSRAAPDLDTLLGEAATRRYPKARLRRTLWAAALGLRREDGLGTPPYIRVLAANSRGRELLGQMRETASLPVLSRPADVKALDQRGQRCFSLGEAASDLYVLGCPVPTERRGGRDRHTAPVML